MQDAPDLSAFPVARRGHSYEDFSVGQVFDHHWGRTINDGDNTLFSTVMCTWQPLYLNRQFAELHGHPDSVVNPMLVLSIVVGLSVEDLSEAGGPFLGIDDCVFEQPVYPGDTVAARSTVLELRESRSRPTDGIVTWLTEGLNQSGEVVVRFKRTNLVARRTADQLP